MFAKLMFTVLVVGMLSIPSVEAQQTDRTKVTNTTVSCGAASAAALAANENRNFLLLVNDHATQVIYLGVDATAALNAGIRINAAGGSLKLDVKVPVGALTCIATGATTTLLISEGTK
jgi:hypothetical protein